MDISVVFTAHMKRRLTRRALAMLEAVLRTDLDLKTSGGDPRVIGGATMFLPQDGNAFDRLLFGFANAYQRAMTELGFPHNAGYCFFFRRASFERLGGIREDMFLNETHDVALRSHALGRFVFLPVVVRTSMRRFRTHGYV